MSFHGKMVIGFAAENLTFLQPAIILH